MSMEKIDRSTILRLAEKNPEIKKLYMKHAKLDKEVEHFGRYAVYSTNAALKEKDLKREKLKTKENLISLVDQYRKSLAA